MKTHKADVVICGAGMAGVSASYHLAVKRGLRNVVLVDERDPLTLPEVAPAFLLERYANPAYQKTIAGLDGSAGQL